jgi:hypothetical protein
MDICLTDNLQFAQELNNSLDGDDFEARRRKRRGTRRGMRRKTARRAYVRRRR